MELGTVVFVLELICMLAFLLGCIYLSSRAEQVPVQAGTLALVSTMTYEEVRNRNVALLERSRAMLVQRNRFATDWVNRRWMGYLRLNREQQLRRIERAYHSNRLSEEQYLELMDQLLDLIILEKATEKA